MYPKVLENLIQSLRVLPGVGKKTAERYALFLLEEDQKVIDDMAQNLMKLKEEIKYCENCHNYSEESLCYICKDSERQNNVICVVSSPKEIHSIEKTNQFEGVYHVLGGLISTKKGVLPEDIYIEDLIKKVKEKKVEEVILALNATIEGEMTSLYISKRLSSDTKVTRLAFGLPIGGQLDYADELTLIKAFEGRNSIE